MDTGYPDASDFRKFLLGAGQRIPDDLDVETKIFSAITEWEDGTGFAPFLADDTTVGSRSFDPPRTSRDLDLGAGLVELTSLTVAGTPFVLGRDFYAYPQNALAKGKPITYLRFYSRPGSSIMQSIVVTGKWGFTTALRANVRNAILCKAALLSAPELEFSITNGVAVAEDIKFASGNFKPIGTLIEEWRRIFKETLHGGGYRRISV
ncbi:hypothetical protein CCAX7_54620 [Capsulimonas corticalis]|uniref:Uncharacterized protein n=1 Tax=Capsulimonas corticalis TaxID=2219043 RepID=A0A402D5U6_9BACT|nr:hypothetical protein [Capsulimonas corticalis]BDI33411.1 hypothetical protein CCAX7_54620 [Capsulimonas corticalis]